MTSDSGGDLAFLSSRILHMDEDLLVLDKPAGISLFADRSGAPCLWDGLRDYCRAEGLPTPRQVHRLDKGTSGVLLIALTLRAQQALTRQFTNREIAKTYVAVIARPLDPPRAAIDLPLCPGRKGKFRVAGPRAEITVDTDVSPPRWRLADGAAPPPGKTAHPSRTDYRVLRPVSGGWLVVLRPLTGRAHQLRVHLAWIGSPIVGDGQYGPGASRKRAPQRGGSPDATAASLLREGTSLAAPLTDTPPAPRLLLHCRKLAVWETWPEGHPPRRIVFRAPVPSEFFG